MTFILFKNKDKDMNIMQYVISKYNYIVEDSNGEIRMYNSYQGIKSLLLLSENQKKECIIF